MSLREKMRNLVTSDDTYNAWSVETNVGGDDWEICKMQMIAKDKRGHDDEVDREIACKSRQLADECKDELEARFPNLKFRVCKVWVDCIRVSDDAEKDLSID